jgi:hypothetical protein
MRFPRVHLLLALAAFLVPFAQVTAQGSKSDLSFGLVGALNIATIGGDDAGGAESKIGFAIGAFLRKQINQTWAFQGEAEYSMKGTQFSGGGATAKLNLNYIEVPLLFRASANPGESTRPFIEFGPALALKAGCTVSAESGSVSGSVSCSSLGEVKSFDAGLMGGAGFEFPVGSNSLSLGARYNLGLIELGDGASVKNRNLQIVLGLRF